MFVLSSPSGAGKTTLSRMLIERDAGLKMSVSATTRPMRPGEVDGRDYFFVDKPRFEAMVKTANCSNGPLCSTTATARRARRSRPRCRPDRTCCSISTGRAPSNCAKKPRADVVSVFILPPSAADLEKRLHTRAQDSDEVIRGRMSRASHELSHWAEYDYIVVNHERR